MSINSDAQKAITDYLTLLSGLYREQLPPKEYAYAGIGDFLLRHGAWHEPQPLPKRLRHGLPRSCFYNALRLAKTRGYTYAEGFAVPDIGVLLPVHHAWNLDGKGGVIDSTWEEPGLAYFGVPFPLHVAHEALRHWGGTVLDNPRAGHALYRVPYAGALTEPVI